MTEKEKENRIHSFALSFLERQQIVPNLYADQIIRGYKEGYHQAEKDLKVKKVEEKFEHPNIEVRDAVEVSSRMPHIDKRLLPIAEFIMDYCSWNLHKDEWNQPVLEVPLFRVLDALVQKGKPYCEG
jgi:hypothetical protein